MARLDHIGDVAPALLVQMAERERVLVLIDSLRYRDPRVSIDRVKLTFPNPAGRWPPTLWRYFESLDGPGAATVSTGAVGEVRIESLPADRSYYLHGAALLAHEAAIRLRLVPLAVYQMPPQLGWVCMEGVELTGPGTFAFQTMGNALTFHLHPGETVRCAPHAFLGMTPGVTVNVRIFGGAPGFPFNHYFPLVDLTGPGDVLVHSGEFLPPSAPAEGP
ncbi:MAG: AIM24 family protein [Thermoplasmata archaeon]